MIKKSLTPEERKAKSKAVFERMIQSVFGGKKEEYNFECHLKKELDNDDTRGKEKKSSGKHEKIIS